ncbi:MAG TPA: hypothetical protein VL688_13205 [Verrucomicrobiae bacterium]|nr:hypothetical protein [Verrucomicrobiae bacterium]
MGSLELAVALLLGSLVAYLGWMALRFEVNPSDSYELFLNARRYAWVDDFPRYWKRAPFVSILLTPVFWLEQHVFGEGFAAPASRLIAVAIFAGFLFAAWKMLCRDLRRGEALLAVFLCGINRLLIHHAPFTKEDIPAALLTALTLNFYRRHLEGRKGSLGLAGLFACCTVLTRYNMIPELLGVIFLNEVLRGSLGVLWRGSGAERRGVLARVFVFAFLPVAVVFGVHTAIYTFYDGVPWVQGPAKLIQDIMLQKKFTSERGDSTWENYAFLWISVTGPVVLAAVLGMVQAWRKKIPEALLYGIWFWIYFLFQTYVLSDKEGRYLFPLLIPVYYFAMLGLREVSEFLREKFAAFSFPEILRANSGAVLAALVLVLPLRAGLLECLKFQDPFYVTDFEKKVSVYAKDMAGPDHKIFWIGKKYPLFPKEHVFHPNDEFAYIYHYYNHVCRYYSYRRVFTLDNAEIVIPAGGAFGFFVPYIGEAAGNGDVLVLNVEPDDYRTSNLPKALNPILVERIRTLTFLPKGPADASGNVQFEAPQLPGSLIQAGPSPEGFQIQGMGLPDSVFELYVTRSGAPHGESVKLIGVKGGAFSLSIPGKSTPSLQNFFLLGYETPAVFFHPLIPEKEVGGSPAAGGNGQAHG